MRHYCNILSISYKDRVTNEKVRSTIKHHIGPHEDLLTTVKIRKLKWFGRVTRSCGLTKTVLQGPVEGKRKRGRQRKRWTDNAEEWTGKPFAETGTGTQPQQMEETAAQLVRTASRRLHGELKERSKARIPKTSDGTSCLESRGCHFILFSYLLSGIPGLSFHTLFLSPVWNPGAVISYLFPISCLESRGCHFTPFPISCLESRGCHFIPFSYLLSGIRGLSFHTFFLSPVLNPGAVISYLFPISCLESRGCHFTPFPVSCLESRRCHFIPFSCLLSGIPGLSFHTFFLSPVWNPGAVISYLFPISFLESRGCHFITFSYLLSGIPGLSFHTFFLSPVLNPGAVISHFFPISCLESRGCHFIPFSYLLSGIPGLSFHTFFLSPVWNPGAVISYLFPISCLESRGCHFIPFSCLLSSFSA